MGPRSHERGNAKIGEALLLIVALQWGRVLMNAETSKPRTRVRVAGRLQWGRVLMNAETLKRLNTRVCPIWLQWGRVLMNAETCRAMHNLMGY